MGLVLGEVLMTGWQQHVKKWTGCQRCELAKGRQRVVLARGRLPAQILFVGEAPGQSEDVLGTPFVGPAGQLLDWIISRALSTWQVPGTEGPDYNSVTYAVTNLVGCLPRSDDGSKAAEPPHDTVMACAPRLQELVALCQPRLIVRVGKLAADYLDQNYRYSVRLPDPVPPMVDVTHPAAIIRMPYAARGLARQRCVVVIRNAVEEFCGLDKV